MTGVAADLELERGVFDVEVAGKAALKLVEQGGQVSVMKQESGTTTCAVSTGRPVATWLACRSCTP